MKNGFGDFMIGLLVGSGACIMIMGLILQQTNYNWQKECIKHGVAQYNSVSGEWEWKVEIDKCK